MEIKGIRWIAVIIILLLVGMVGYQLGKENKIPIVDVALTFKEKLLANIDDMAYAKAEIERLLLEINDTKEIMSHYYESDQQLDHDKL